MLAPRLSRRTAVFGLALALFCAAAPVALRAQDTVKVPAAAQPGVDLPAGTRITRPPVQVRAAPTLPADIQAAGQQQLVTVPDLSGRTVAEARRLLVAAGLELGRVAEGSGSGTAGTVMQQQPRAGSVVAPRSDVRLWLVPAEVASRPQEPARATVPRLVGRTVDDARGMLAQASLEVEAVAELAGTGAPGTVVRQSPQAGTAVAPKSGVRLWVVPARVAQQPRGPAGLPLVRVPSLVGSNVDDARKTLSSAGLQVLSLAEGPAVRGVPGTVARQQPAAGSSVLPNSGVRLWLVPAPGAGQVATRPDPPAGEPATPPVQRPAPREPAVQTPSGPATPPAVRVDSLAVPDVRRLALGEARAALQAAGLAAAFDATLADSATWTVSTQQPGPGARLASGGVVALLLDPPASPVAGTAAPVPPVPAGASGFQPSPATPPVVPQPWMRRNAAWMLIAAALLMAAAAAAAAGARRMRVRGHVPPVAGVSARLRMDSPARVAVVGAPFGPGALRFRVKPGRSAVRVAAAGPLFASREVPVD